MLLAAGLAAGCSMLRVSYVQGPTITYWWFDSFVDFTDAQRPRVKEALADWFRWHRATQLPGYAPLLARARVESTHDATAEQMCRWWDEIEARADTAVQHALPQAAAIAATLTPAQLQHLEKRYAKGLAEARRDYLQPDRDERRKAAVKRTVDRVEFFYGRLDDAQRRRIAAGVDASPFDAERWIAERLARQQDTLAALRRISHDHASPEDAQAALRALVARFRDSPRPAYRDYQQRLVAYNCAFAAEIHNAMTPAQRQKARERLAGWEHDIAELTNGG